jgi:uroporphyrinogen-III decarboxylase
MTGVYVTLISGLIDLFGWDLLLLAAGTDQARFGALAARYASWIQQYFDALAEADVPVVMVHDDIVWAAGPILRPAWYRQFVFPYYKRYFAPLLDSSKRIMFCSDGSFDAFVDDIAATGVHGFVFEPLTDLEYIAEHYGQTHVLIGNVDTRVLLTGSKEQIRAEVERCVAIGRDCPGYFMAVGNHIPPNTPVESALYYNQVYEELSCR